MAPTGKLGNEADEGQFAFSGHTEIEFEETKLRVAAILDGEQLDLGIVKDRGKGGIVHDQPRKPQPAGSD